MIRVYVAGASAEIDRCADFMALLAAEPTIKVISDWPKVIKENGGIGNPLAASHSDRRAWAETDLRQVASSDLLWLVYPSVPNYSEGAMGEFTYAWSQSLHLIVSGGYKRSIFTALADHLFSAHEDALAYIINRSLA